MTNPKRYLVTAALPYANGLKHIGHLAGAYIPADIYARYLRAQKRDVVFVCGSDEHDKNIKNENNRDCLFNNFNPRYFVGHTMHVSPLFNR